MRAETPDISKRKQTLSLMRRFFSLDWTKGLQAVGTGLDMKALGKGCVPTQERRWTLPLWAI
jgi:hypothetical protein